MSYALQGCEQNVRLCARGLKASRAAKNSKDKICQISIKLGGVMSRTKSTKQNSLFLESLKKKNYGFAIYLSGKLKLRGSKKGRQIHENKLYPLLCPLHSPSTSDKSRNIVPKLHKGKHLMTCCLVRLFDGKPVQLLFISVICDVRTI